MRGLCLDLLTTYLRSTSRSHVGIQGGLHVACTELTNTNKLSLDLLTIEIGKWPCVRELLAAGDVGR